MSRESRPRTDRDVLRKRSCRLTVELLESRRLLSATPSSMFEWAEPARMSLATEMRWRTADRVAETRAELAVKFEPERVLAGPFGSTTVATILSGPRHGSAVSSVRHPPSVAATFPSFHVFVGRQDANITRPVSGSTRINHTFQNLRRAPLLDRLDTLPPSTAQRASVSRSGWSGSFPINAAIQSSSELGRGRQETPFFRDRLFEDAESSFGATTQQPRGGGFVDIAVNFTGTTPQRRPSIVIAVPIVVNSTEPLQTDVRRQVSPARDAWTESGPSRVAGRQLDGGVVDLSVADGTPVRSEPTTRTLSPYPLNSSSTLSGPPTLPSIAEANTRSDTFVNVPSMRYAPQAHGLAAQHSASNATIHHLKNHGIENGGFVELGNQLESISNANQRNTVEDPQIAAAPSTSLDVTPEQNAAVSHRVEVPFAPAEGIALDADALVDSVVKYSAEGGMIELPRSAESVELPNPAHRSGEQQNILLASVGPRTNDTGLGLYRAFEFAIAIGDPIKLSDVSIDSAVQYLYPADEAELSHGEKSVSAAYRATVALPAITLAATVFAIRSRRRKALMSEDQCVTDSRDELFRSWGGEFPRFR